MESYIQEQIRQLRRNSTPAEQVLWQKLRNRKLMGTKFLRQHPIFFLYENQYRYFIPDFYCAEHRLVIEVDGKIHDQQKEYDAMRTAILNVKGISVVRFKNEEVLEDIEKVLGTLMLLIPDPSLSTREGRLK